MIYIVRKEHFNAAHKLFNPSWSKEKNQKEFGVCSNKNWHGHNYEIEVTLKGKIDPGSGMLINLKILSKILKDEILDERIKSLNISCSLHKIRLYETPRNFVEYYGEN
jgi:6-pyruvoyltetrahydropterin/6-carboxytetrahydropterin synthase